MIWYVYMAKCRDNSYYTGITTDIVRRISEHNQSTKVSAKYTRSRRPVRLVHQEIFHSRGAALKREVAIKKLSHSEKGTLSTDKS